MSSFCNVTSKYNIFNGSDFMINDINFGLPDVSFTFDGISDLSDVMSYLINTEIKLGLYLLQSLTAGEDFP